MAAQPSELYVDEGEQRWPLVTNPAARRVLDAVFAEIPHALPPLPLERLRRAPPYATPAGIAIRQRLRGSSIAQAIAGGPDLLPDYYEYLPALWRPAARLLKHRSQSQYAVHVLNKLDWYLRPPAAIEPPPGLAPQLAGAALILLALLAGVWLFGASFSYDVDFYTWVAVLAVMLATCTPLLLAWLLQHLGRRTGSDVAAVEFFLYLLESYSDAEAVPESHPPLAASAEAQSIPGADVPCASGATDVSGTKTHQAD